MPFKAIMMAAAVALCVAAIIVAQTETEHSRQSPDEVFAAASPGTTGSRVYRGGRR